jgi:hypothetical protein
MSKLELILIISVVALLVNIPFGALRLKYKKLSIPWFLCIHAPIPIVASIRILTKVSMYYIPLFLLLSIIGQILGARIKKFS